MGGSEPSRATIFRGTVKAYVFDFQRSKAAFTLSSSKFSTFANFSTVLASKYEEMDHKPHETKNPQTRFPHDPLKKNKEPRHPLFIVLLSKKNQNCITLSVYIFCINSWASTHCSTSEHVPTLQIGRHFFPHKNPTRNWQHKYKWEMKILFISVHAQQTRYKQCVRKSNPIKQTP